MFVLASIGGGDVDAFEGVVGIGDDVPRWSGRRFVRDCGVLILSVDHCITAATGILPAQR